MVDHFQEDVRQGDKLCEYTGEVITKEETQQRMREKSLKGEEDVYFAALSGDLLLDADVSALKRETKQPRKPNKSFLIVLCLAREEAKHSVMKATPWCLMAAACGRRCSVRKPLVRP
jgi:hypothetical protein